MLLTVQRFDGSTHLLDEAFSSLAKAIDSALAVFDALDLHPAVPRHGDLSMIKLSRTRRRQGKPP